jgi:hypothetical protein
VNWKALAAGVGGLAGAGVALYWLKKQGYGGRVTLSAPSNVTFCKDVFELRGRVTQFFVFPVSTTVTIYFFYKGQKYTLISGLPTDEHGNFVLPIGPLSLGSHADADYYDTLEFQVEATIVDKTYLSPRVPVTVYAPACTGPC